MTKNDTVKKIDKIVTKINENLPKESLSKGEVEKLLNSIDDGLIEVEESAEGNQKEIVSKKVEELRNIIDSSRRWMWGRISGALENIGQDLEELKNSLSDKSAVAIYGFGESAIGFNDKDKEELIKWRKVFSGKSPEEVNEYLKKLAEEWIENKRRFEMLEKRTGEVAEMTSSKEVVELSQEVNRMGISYVEAGGKAGGPVLGILGNLIGAGLATYQGTTIAGAKIYEDTLKTGVGFTSHIADNTREVIKEGMSSTKEVAKDFIGIFNRKKITQSLEEKNKTLEQQLEKKDEELKQRLEEMSERIERKNEEIKDLRERKDNEIRRLQANNDKLQEQLISQIAQVEKKPYSRQ